ncbi:MAG: leucine-rich repeat protein [Kiritimatiellia bacterium]
MNTRTIIAFACAGLFAVTSIFAQAPGHYLTFSSTNTFTITPQQTSWDGTLEYSTDATTWANFTTAGAAAADDGSGEFRLYLRGTSNTYVTGFNKPGWQINASAPVACSGNIETLLDYATVTNGGHPVMDAHCFVRLFDRNTSLVSAPTLPATNLAPYCYESMFYGCTSLMQAPELPATNLAEHCYSGMFYGCTSLTQAPALPATNLANSCYSSMFGSCTGLTQAPPLPATTSADRCYAGMFYGCIGLTQAPPLPATTVAEYCYYNMFYGCTALTAPPALPATNLADHCYANMFYNCTSLTQAPALPATNLATYCYQYMFYGCTSLTKAPALPATTVATLCCEYMFQACTALTSAPAELPATTLALSCYKDMFYGCTSLTNAPALPATNLATSCYASMFGGCSALTEAPELPATIRKQANRCYQGMFAGCTALTSAQAELPSTTLSEYCYSGMFYGCTGLTNAPALPAKTAIYHCYNGMFRGCTGLTHPPALPAETLAQSCYSGMFQGCTGLASLPTLPAMTLTTYCYSYMFQGCTGIKLNTEGPGAPWGIPKDAVAWQSWCTWMFRGTGGTFTNNPEIGVTYYFPLVTPPAPSGVSASDGTFANKIRITWHANSLASGCRIWRHTANNSAVATEIGSTSGTTYDDTTAVAKTTYYYWVKATNSVGVSGFSKSDSGWRAIPVPVAPTGVTASDGVHTDKIRITWKASAGATSYKVYRHTSNKPGAASKIGTSATTAYNDTTAKSDVTYYYWVKAVNESGASGFSAADTGYLGVVGPLVAVNGMVGNNIRIPANKPITITATMMNLPRAYLGVNVDWWVAAYVHQGGLWFYFDTNFNLVQFDGNLANCRPAYQGPLYNVPQQTLVENMVLPHGTYNVWFAVDYPMDGRIDLNGAILLSTVTIVVE